MNEVQEKDVVPRLLAVLPGIANQWDEHTEWWGAEEPGAYNNTGEIARYLVQCLGNDNVQEFPAVFAAVEDVLGTGTPQAKNLIVVGLLESLQNIASHTPEGYSDFEPWLGPQAAQAWKDLERMWEGKSSLMDVVRSEADQHEPDH